MPVANETGSDRRSFCLKLTLDSAQTDAMEYVALQERVNDQDWYGCDDDG